jgi:outer membrane receptor for ferrienterochelin and colicin
MKIRYLILLLVLMIPGVLLSQQNTINGYAEDSQTGERLIGVTLYDSLAKFGCTTNEYGFFSIKTRSNKVTLVCSYLGYEVRSLSFNLSRDTTLVIKLEPRNYILNEVVVQDTKGTLRSSSVSTTVMPVATIKRIPSLMGETDVLKAIQLLPGVQTGTEGTSGIIVRGGGPDQTLILLDGITIYNPDHLFGFVSIFNPDALKNVTLIKGGFPAHYGGRLSSIVDISMKEGNMLETHTSASVGLLSSKLLIEGPVVKEKSSFLVSARRTFFDLITNNLLKKKDLPEYGFYDLTLKMNYIFSNKNRIYLSLYSGKDRIGGITTNSQTQTGILKYNYTNDHSYGWGNFTSCLRWNTIFNNKLFANTSINYSNYYYYDKKFIQNRETNLRNNFIRDQVYKSDFHSGITDLSVKTDFNYQPVAGHSLKFGIGFIDHLFTPNASINTVTDTLNRFSDTENIYKIKALESYAYIEDDIEFSSRLKVNSGIRYTGFFVDGVYYNSFEPRISGRYLLTDQLSVKMAYSRMKQYAHLLSSSNVTFSSDLWVPSTSKVLPEVSDQITLGSVFSSGQLEFSLETYYKTMDNLIEYSEGSSFLDNNLWETKIENDGTGKAYGLEAYLAKNAGKTTGWISYSLAWSYRRFGNINFGNWYPYKYDRRHDIGVVINHAFNKKVDIGITWEFYSGKMFTVISQTYLAEHGIDNELARIQYFESRNNYRLPAYHRMDFNINFHKQKRNYSRTWSINIYNVYNNMNTFFVYYGNDDKNGRKDILVLKKYTLFPVLPSFTYSIQF